MQLANIRIYPAPRAPIMGRASSPSVLRFELSRQEKRAISLGLVTLSSLCVCFLMVLGYMLVNGEPLSVSDPLKEIRLVIKRMDQERFFNRLSMEEQKNIASQVHFVSEIISRTTNRGGNKELAYAIVSESRRANVDPLLVTAVVKSESTFKTSAISNKGARGLMQLLPTTARYTEDKIQPVSTRRSSKRNLHHIDYNLELGIAYLKHLEDLFSGNRELALIAYNWGPGNLRSALRNKSHIPEETKIYARKIIRNHSKWQNELRMNAQYFEYLNLNKLA